MKFSTLLYCFLSHVFVRSSTEWKKICPRRLRFCSDTDTIQISFHWKTYDSHTHKHMHTHMHTHRHTRKQTHLTLKSDTRRMWRTSWTVPFYTCRSKDFLVSILHLSAGFWRWSARVPGSRFTERGPAAGQSSDPGRLYRERSVRHHLHTGQNSGILTLSGGETAGQEGRSLTTR